VTEAKPGRCAVASVSRRVILRAGGGAAGAIVLAACGETQIVTVEKIVEKEVPVERIVTKEVPVEKVVIKEVVVEKIVEAEPQAQTVSFEFLSDHTSGPRAKAVKWALERYAQERPDVNVVFVPNADDINVGVPVRVAAGTLSEIALLAGQMLFNFGPDGGFLPIDDIAAKNERFKPESYVFSPDHFSANLHTTYPYMTDFAGPLYGMPFQEVASGFLYNIDMFEAGGVDEPADSWTYGTEYLDAARRLTNPDASEFGTLIAGGNDIDAWCPMVWGMGSKQFVSPDNTEHWLFKDGGANGLEFAVGLIHSERVSPVVDIIRELGGEFGSPFNAGRVAMRRTQSGTTGFRVPRIKDRFRWAVGPQIRGDVEGVGTSLRQNQPHLVSAAAFKRGNAEAVTDFAIFMAGPEVQGRVAIDRGAAPSNWEAYKGAGAVAPPPLGMERVETHVRNPSWRQLPKYLGPSYSEWLAFRGPMAKVFIGEQAVPEGIQASDKLVADLLESGRENIDRIFSFWGKG
jgi:ABC-type glycerol-3-phosphate transport system substrate-binding protein